MNQSDEKEPMEDPCTGCGILCPPSALTEGACDECAPDLGITHRWVHDCTCQPGNNPAHVRGGISWCAYRPETEVAHKSNEMEAIRIASAMKMRPLRGRR